MALGPGVQTDGIADFRVGQTVQGVALEASGAMPIDGDAAVPLPLQGGYQVAVLGEKILADEEQVHNSGTAPVKRSLKIAKAVDSS